MNICERIEKAANDFLENIPAPTRLRYAILTPRQHAELVAVANAAMVCGEPVVSIEEYRLTLGVPVRIVVLGENAITPEEKP